METIAVPGNGSFWGRYARYVLADDPASDLPISDNPPSQDAPP